MNAAHEQRDVLAPLAQRRQIDPQHVQPVDTDRRGTLPSSTSSRSGRFVAATTRTSTLIGCAPPTRVNSRSSSTRSSFTCVRRRDLADLVEEQRPRVGELEAPEPPLGRAGERALLVAEQLALEQRLRQRADVHGDERLVAPRAERADRARDELLAGAALALDRAPCSTPAPSARPCTITSRIASLSPISPVSCCSRRRSRIRRRPVEHFVEIHGLREDLDEAERAEPLDVAAGSTMSASPTTAARRPTAVLHELHVRRVGELAGEHDDVRLLALERRADVVERRHERGRRRPRARAAR